MSQMSQIGDGYCLKPKVLRLLLPMCVGDACFLLLSRSKQTSRPAEAGLRNSFVWLVGATNTWSRERDWEKLASPTSIHSISCGEHSFLRQFSLSRHEAWYHRLNLWNCLIRQVWKRCEHSQLFLSLALLVSWYLLSCPVWSSFRVGLGDVL